MGRTTNCGIYKITSPTGIFYFGAEEASEAKNIPKSTVREQITRLKVNKLDLIHV